MIRSLRRAMKLTQGQFGKQVGAHKITVSRWESNLAVPRRLHSRRIRDLAKTVESVMSKTEKRKYPVDWRY